MANFSKHIDSPTRRKLQRLVDDVTKTDMSIIDDDVRQTEKGYAFSGKVKGRPLTGYFLGKNRLEAKAVLENLIELGQTAR